VEPGNCVASEGIELLTQAPVETPRAQSRQQASARSIERLRLVLVTTCLTFLVFSQAAGNTVADTKIDLVVSPARFLKRSLSMWDSLSGAGQLQNQAYGYLFPMGPFFAAAHAMRIPPWEVQRLWQTALVVAGFLGMVRLSRLLGVPGFWPRVAAGLVYALAPRFISELTAISSELLPVAALPWVLIPLVRGSRSGSPRRAAARSGVALLFAGGINAAATVAILPVPLLWLLTRERGSRRGALLRWWLLCTALASAWWAIPLVLLGKYSPPFLDWVESASTTTIATPLLSSLRGVDHWESLLGPGVWPSAWIFATARAAIVATCLVAAGGLSGLAPRRQPHRLFLIASMLLGLVLVTAGHVSEVGPPWAEQLQRLLDGPLVAFRNVHKFDPMIRLPLAVGVGALLGRLQVPSSLSLARPGWNLRLPVRALVVLTVLGIGAVAISPVLTNQVASSGRLTPEPSWWRSAGDWLGAHGNGSRTLVVPASASPVYLWGPTVDTALQAVAKSPWSVRDAVPLAQPGYTRLLDEIDGILADGRRNDALAPILARAGIGWIAVANDLDTLKSHATAHMFTQSTIGQSPGFSLRESFGPDVGAGALSSIHMLDVGATQPRRAVQIFEVLQSTDPVALEPLDGAVSANGASDNLGSMIAAGLSSQTPVFFDGDAEGLTWKDERTVLTDGIRKRQATFGNSNAKSATMTAAAPYTTRRPVNDYLPDKVDPLSTIAYEGFSNVTASSSGSDLLAFYNRGQGNGPWSALDDDPRTAWMSSGFSGSIGQWLDVQFDQSRAIKHVSLSFATVKGPMPTQVAVRTDSGVVIDAVHPDSNEQTLTVPSGQTKNLRITIASVADHTFGTTVGISTLTIPGLNPRRALQIPNSGSPDQLVFAAAQGWRGDCLVVADRPACDPTFAQSGEEDSAIDRTFTLAKAAQYRLSAKVRLRGGAALETILRRSGDPVVTASSVNSDDPRQAARLAIDGNPNTTWQAAPGDAAPTLRLDLGAARKVDTVTLKTDPRAAVAQPLTVTVVAGSQHWSGSLPEDGVIRFAKPAQSRTIKVIVDIAKLRDTTSSISFATRLLPVGISEVEVNSRSLGRSSPPGPWLATGCLSSLSMRLDGRAIPVRILTDRSAALSGGPATVLPCGDPVVSLSAGTHSLSLVRTQLASPVSISASRVGYTFDDSAGGTGSSLSVVSWSPTHRRIAVNAKAESVIVVRENANDGWHATIGGQKLRTLRVDGWQQGFVVPAGTAGEVVLDFGPQRTFTAGMIVAIGCIVILLIMTFRSSRKDTAAPIGDRRIRTGVLVIALCVAVGLLGSWSGLLALAAMLIAVIVVERSGYSLPAWSGAVLLVVPSLLQARANAFTIFQQVNSANSQLLCLAALCVTVLGSARRHETDE